MTDHFIPWWVPNDHPARTAPEGPDLATLAEEKIKSLEGEAARLRDRVRALEARYLHPGEPPVVEPEPMPEPVAAEVIPEPPAPVVPATPPEPVEPVPPVDPPNPEAV